MLKLFKGRTLIVVVMLVFFAGYYFWLNHFNWYSDSFFIDEFEKYTEIKLETKAEVIWKWAAPRGSDWKSHYVTAAIISPAFKAASIDPRFELQSDCYKLSGGAKRFLTEASPLQCWYDAGGPMDSESFLILYAKTEGILLFKKKTN